MLSPATRENKGCAVHAVAGLATSVAHVAVALFLLILDRLLAHSISLLESLQRHVKCRTGKELSWDRDGSYL